MIRTQHLFHKCRTINSLEVFKWEQLRLRQPELELCPPALCCRIQFASLFFILCSNFEQNNSS